MIEQITLRNFRNHLEATFQLTQNVFIQGDNGAGKTSLLEAIYYVSLLKSHRTTDDNALIMNNKPYAKLSIKTTDHFYEVVIHKDKKHLTLDKVHIKKMSHFIGGYKVVIFSPEDLDLIKGLPRIRRQFLDIEMFQINPDYMDVLTSYKKVLNQRNGLLKRLTLSDDFTFLNIITKRYIEEAKMIMTQREAFVNALNKAFKSRFKHLNDFDEVEVVYEPNTPINALEETLKSRMDKDILSKTTTYGPHRDDFTLLFNGSPAKEFASQGQQRLMTIALKLAMIDLIKEDVIILLDDVLSELDDKAIVKIEQLFGIGKQVIITGTNNPFDINTIKLKEGNEYGSKQQL